MIDDASTMWELVERRAAATPNSPALLDPSDRAVTFLELKQWAEKTAAGLAALGVGSGTPVSLQLPTRIETVVVSLALARLGAVQNPILHLYREREVGVVLRSWAPSLYACPGNWRGVDYPAMVESAAAALNVAPRIVNGYDRVPEGDPATLPPPPAPESGDVVRVGLFHVGDHVRAEGSASHGCSAGGCDLRRHGIGDGSPGRVRRPVPADPYRRGQCHGVHAGGGVAVVLLETFVAAEAVEVCAGNGRRSPVAAPPSTWCSSTSSASGPAYRSSRRLR